MNFSENIDELKRRFEGSEPENILSWAWDNFGKRAAIGTSFQGAGLVVMHLSKQMGLQFPVFTIDTGLLFKETLLLKEKLEQFFEIKIVVLKPSISVSEQAKIYGDTLWKSDPDLCCTIRKVIPLQNHLAQLDCWITGLRRQQSQTRSGISIVEVYQLNSNQDIVKLNPLANWDRTSIWDYIRKHNIPYNELHDKGYRSIGCTPCTSVTVSEENERAGRWIGFQKTECGIHTFLQKKLN